MIIDALKNLAVAIAGDGEPSDITETQIADVIQYIADNWTAGGGGSYVLPEATASTLGGVKQATSVTDVSVADATAAGSAYDQTVAQTAVALANANKAAINNLLAALRAAGIVASEE